MEGLFFANGVALGPDERFVLVNETVTGRVHRLLKGDRRGERDIFIDGLPAMVDNISFNGSDTFGWLRPTPERRWTLWLISHYFENSGWVAGLG